MSQMDINKAYKPPQTYMEQQQNDPAFFKYQYEQYALHIANDQGDNSYNNSGPVLQQNSVSEDREESSYSKQGSSDTNWNQATPKA